MAITREAAPYTPGTGGSIDTFKLSDNAKRQGVSIADPENLLDVARVTEANGVEVDVTRAALPTGAATSALQTTLNGYVDGIETVLGTPASVEAASGDGDLIALLKRLRTLMAQPSGNTQGNVTVTTTSTDLIAANTNRRRAALYNSGATNVFIGIAATPTTALFAFRLAPNEFWEMPWPPHSGVIRGIVAAGTCVVQTSEWT